MIDSALPRPTILLTGVNGQIGFELARSLRDLSRVVALDRAGGRCARYTSDWIKLAVRGRGGAGAQCWANGRRC